MKSILEGLAADHGTALDAFNPETVVYAETMATARAIARAWGTNQRVSNVWDPLRCGVEILERWEAFLVMLPAPTDTVPARRKRIAEVLSRFGKAPTHDRVSTLLSGALGAAFVAVEHLSFANARITVPDGSYPWGVVAADSPWSSNVGKVLVRLKKPTGWTEADFYDAAAKVFSVLDPILPAWTTLDWYRPGTTSVNVVGGPSAGGFYLDDANNLDNQVFDV